MPQALPSLTGVGFKWPMACPCYSAWYLEAGRLAGCQTVQGKYQMEPGKERVLLSLFGLGVFLLLIFLMRGSLVGSVSEYLWNYPGGAGKIQ